MKKLFTLFKGLIGKGLALILLAALTVFSIVFNVTYLIYRLLADVIAIIGTVLIGAECFTTGFTVEIGYAIASVVAIMALRFTLPLLVPIMKQWSKDLKNYIHAPIFKAPPVRYTI